MTDNGPNPAITSFFYRLFFDKELRAVTIQVITMALIFAFFFFILNNAITNLEAIGKGYSFRLPLGCFELRYQSNI